MTPPRRLLASMAEKSHQIREVRQFRPLEVPKEVPELLVSTAKRGQCVGTKPGADTGPTSVATGDCRRAKRESCDGAASCAGPASLGPSLRGDSDSDAPRATASFPPDRSSGREAPLLPAVTEVEPPPPEKGTYSWGLLRPGSRLESLEAGRCRRGVTRRRSAPVLPIGTGFAVEDLGKPWGASLAPCGRNEERVR